MGRTHRTCRRCGFGIPADAPLCPGCRRPAIDDWRRRARAVATAERRALKAEPPLHADGYRPLLSRAIRARALLAATAAIAVVTALAHVVAIVRDGGQIEVGSSSVDPSTVTRPVTVALLGAVALTGVVFIAWAVRAYRNLPALEIRERRYWTIWLVIGWVMPGANLLVPKLVVDDIWRASSPQARIGGSDEWQRRPVASIVNRWWSSFLLSPAIALLAVVVAQGGIEGFDRRAAVGALCAAAAAAVVVAATAARRLVAVVTVAQARRADVIVDVREDRWAAQEHLLASIVAPSGSEP